LVVLISNKYTGKQVRIPAASWKDANFNACLQWVIITKVVVVKSERPLRFYTENHIIE
jgi:hypothetical protein